ncbi:MAG: cupredoxin domain-containing protein [Thaumarchaeota archaeon]|nr:cupredoxin domain-containing protein [Nitrososphaerota archaeon]
MRSVWSGVLALILTVVIMPAFADGSNVSVNITGGSEAGQGCISAKNCYDPDTITVPPKTVISWTNIDSTAHTVTSGTPSGNNTGEGFDSGTIGPGGTYSFIFISSGTYDYFCSIHPWMTGEVIVTSPLATNSSGNSATTPEFGPLVILVFVIAIFSTIFLTKNRLIFRF